MKWLDFISENLPINSKFENTFMIQTSYMELQQKHESSESIFGCPSSNQTDPAVTLLNSLYYI